MRNGRALIALLVVVLVARTGLAKSPNVVMIISDDQAWTDFGFMGHPTIKTPHLDRLAAESAVFERGYVPTSLCRPSLATLITGLYPHQHKISGNDPAQTRDKSKRDEWRQQLIAHIDRVDTLPKLLAPTGYVSFQTGKWWEGNYRRGGFTQGMTHGDPKRGGRHGDAGLKIGRNGMQPIYDFIKDAGGKPFFIWHAPFLPHTPHNPPQRLLDKYTSPDRPLPLARYYAMCEWFDETCGELLDHLDEKKLSQDTLVVFVTDNGWIQRTPQSKVPDGWRFGFAPKSKRSPNEGGVRTPIMLRWPGQIKPAKYDTLASSIDLAPTILAAAGLSIPKTMPGINLIDVASASGKTDRTTIFGEIFDHDVADIEVPAKSLQFRWCISGKWKAIIPAAGSHRAELFDLSADPHETKNLASAHPDELTRLVKLTDKWWLGKADKQ